MKMKIMLVFVLQLLFVVHFYGQHISSELISSAGDKFTNSSYQLDWSIGEIQIETYSNSNNIQTQGFHQTGDILSVLKLDIVVPFEITVSPNPTHRFLYIDINENQLDNLKFTLMNAYGLLVNSDKITNLHHEISFENYTKGTYFLSVWMNNQILKSFKIIKN